MTTSVRKPNEGKILSSSTLQSYQCSRGGGGRKVILPSLPDLHDFSQSECNISILVSVSLCGFAVLHLRVEPHATNPQLKPLKNRKGCLQGPSRLFMLETQFSLTDQRALTVSVECY